MDRLITSLDKVNIFSLSQAYYRPLSLGSRRAGLASDPQFPMSAMNKKSEYIRLSRRRCDSVMSRSVNKWLHIHIHGQVNDCRIGQWSWKDVHI